MIQGFSLFLGYLPDVSHVPPAKRMPFAMVALVLLRTSVTADMIGCLQMGALDLVARENKKPNACGL